MARKPQVKLKGAYGKPLSKAAGAKLPMTSDMVDTCADIILKAVKREIRRDIALQAGVRGKGDPVPIPNSRRFINSFKVRVKGSSTIEITSNWPTAQAHTTKLKAGFADNMRPDRSAPIEMTWLRRPEVPYAKIVQADGQIVIRTTPDPNQGDKYWVHPGFRKYTFLERGLRKGKEEAIKAILEDLLVETLKEYDLFG